MNSKVNKLKEVISDNPKDRAIVNTVVSCQNYTYLRTHCVGPKVCDDILQTNDRNAIKSVLKTNQIISANFEYKVACMGDYDLIMDLVKRKLGLCADVEMALVNEKETSFITEYIKKHSLSEDAEARLISTYPIKKLSEYVKQYKLSDKAEYMLLKKPTLLAEYVKYHRLSIGAFKHFLQYNFNAVVLDIYVKKQLTIDEEFVFFRYADEASISKYLDNFEVVKIDAIIKILLERKMYKTAIKLIKVNRPLSDFTEKLILDSGNHLLILAYIECFSLSEDNQLKLIARGKTSEIIKYARIKERFFQYRAQLALIERGKTSEIVAMIKGQPIADVCQVMIIERGNADEIIACCESYRLCNESQVALINRGIDCEIEAYINKKELCDEALILLIKNKYELLRKYISWHALDTEPLKAFIKSAKSPEIDILMKKYFPDI